VVRQSPRLGRWAKLSKYAIFLPSGENVGSTPTWGRTGTARVRDLGPIGGQRGAKNDPGRLQHHRLAAVGVQHQQTRPVFPLLRRPAQDQELRAVTRPAERLPRLVTQLDAVGGAASGTRGVDCPDPLAVAIGDPALHTPPKRIRRSRRRDRSSPVAVTRWPIPTLSPSASMRSSRYRTSEAHRPQRQHRLLSPRQGRPKSTTCGASRWEVGGGSLLLPTPFRKRRGSRDARPRSANAAPAGRGRDGREARDLMALVHPIGHPFAQDRLCIPVWAT
jgi:hypothetical protein